MLVIKIHQTFRNIRGFQRFQCISLKHPSNIVDIEGNTNHWWYHCHNRSRNHQLLQKRRLRRVVNYIPLDIMIVQVMYRCGIRSWSVKKMKSKKKKEKGLIVGSIMKRKIQQVVKIGSSFIQISGEINQIVKCVTMSGPKLATGSKRYKSWRN